MGNIAPLLIFLVLAAVLIGIVVWQSSTLSNYERAREELTNAPIGPGTELQAVCNGAQIVPQTLTLSATSGGQAQLLLSVDRRTLQYSVYVGNLTSKLTRATFNNGAIGENGPALRDFTGEFVEQLNAQGVTGEFRGAWAGVSADIAAKFLAGQMYVLIATERNPEGELRGQIQT